MAVSDDDASDQIENDVEEDDKGFRNHELCYDCEDDCVGRHEDCSEDDKVEQTDIPDCNHADGGRGHTTTVVLEEVELDDHCRTVELEDVEGVDPIYENAIALENNLSSPDDSDQERVNTRAELKRALSMLALKEHFEFRVKTSCQARFEVGCKDKACKFALRATKLLKGEYWHVWMLHKVHTCTVDGLQCGYRTASARVIDELISSRVQGNCVTPLRPKEIMEEMNRKWGLQCLYGKALQAKEYAESLMFGLLEELFQLLPSYFHMLERENPSTVTCVTTDGEQRFKYCFWGFGSCIRGFNAIYPLAFGIGHVEDEESWSWFLNQLRRAIDYLENAIFISDQHLGIKNAVEKVYKDAHYAIFTMATNYYRVTDFDKHMNKLKQLCRPAYDSLMRLGLERWARARSLVRRYKLMTSNSAKCINSCLRQFNEACHFSVQAIDWVEFQVIGGSKDRVMNLSTKECSCGEFQFDLLPCTYAVAAISACKHSAIEFCLDYYKTRSWAEGYVIPIRPVRHPSEWDIPDDIQQNVFLPPSWRGQVGRPRRKRIP
ncbi:PREDICTED: uncharacterized protein LOC108661392 [Theobroma cacao]|uniref:Uncharacterized protein LOC108661392 n=1 Tax=Theobroma cacao TaxID=3641 RepID=A0AB32W1L8_THECC|nr:PREDICTED: uncharacterized protein LOC108661392 [Theobroma cacao]